MRARTLACPECGADARSGWRDEDAGEGLGLPDDEFDYDAFVREEFGGGTRPPRGVHPLWWIVGLALVAIFAFAMIG